SNCSFKLFVYFKLSVFSFSSFKAIVPGSLPPCPASNIIFLPSKEPLGELASCSDESAASLAVSSSLDSSLSVSLSALNKCCSAIQLTSPSILVCNHPHCSSKTTISYTVDNVDSTAASASGASRTFTLSPST